MAGHPITTLHGCTSDKRKLAFTIRGAVQNLMKAKVKSQLATIILVLRKHK